MNIREKLIDIVDTNNGWVDEVPAEQFADYLLRNYVVPIVQCRDCEYYEFTECVCPYILMSDGAKMYTDPYDFCSHGERKEGAENG